MRSIFTLATWASCASFRKDCWHTYRLIKVKVSLNCQLWVDFLDPDGFFFSAFCQTLWQEGWGRGYESKVPLSSQWMLINTSTNMSIDWPTTNSVSKILNWAKVQQWHECNESYGSASPGRWRDPAQRRRRPLRISGCEPCVRLIGRFLRLQRRS